MTRNILLTVAAVFILGLLGFWSYLLFFGSPDSTNQVFVDLGLKNPTTERPLLITEIDKSKSDILAMGEVLNQLTIRPVAGYVATSRPTDRIRYAERGTGHIYEINFTTSLETRIVGNTIGKTTNAYFSPDGILAVLISETDTGTAATMITIPEITGAAPITTDLPDNIYEVKAISSTSVNYLQTVNEESVAYRFNRLTGTAEELWRIPLTDIKVWWGGNKTYVVTKAAPYLKGAVYEVIGSSELAPITEQKFSYTALTTGNANYLIETSYNTEQGVIGSNMLNTTDKSRVNISTLAIPEKCAINPNNSNDLWCGAMAPTKENRYRDFIKDWYMGTVTSDDYLWNTNISNQKTKPAISLREKSGLIIDLIEPRFNQGGSRLFFLNKIDGTLWFYQIGSATAAREDQVNSAAIPLNP